MAERSKTSSSRSSNSSGSRFAAGVAHAGYGHGLAVADYDNDGFPDIYVTNVGGNVLYHNQGDGTFLEVTQIAGVDTKLWSSSAASSTVRARGPIWSKEEP